MMIMNPLRSSAAADSGPRPAQASHAATETRSMVTGSGFHPASRHAAMASPTFAISSLERVSLGMASAQRGHAGDEAAVAVVSLKLRSNEG
jgi:hypothetical protein